MRDVALAVTLSLVAAVVARAPFAWLRAMGVPLAWLLGLVRRRQVHGALARAGLPEARGSEMYRSLAAGVMELLWLAGAPRRELGGVVRVDAASQVLLDEALAAGRGAVMAASHTGNWELAACAMAARVPLSVLVKRVSIGGFDRFMRRVRGRYAVGLIEGDGALGRARAEVSRGHVVAVLADQVPPRASQGVWVSFMGEEALTDRAAAVLAASTGAPLVVTAQRRTSDGSHVLHVLSVKWPPEDGQHAWTLEATRESAAELAGFVTRHPDQWLWLHRRWRQPIAPAARLVTAPPAH